MCKWKRFVAVCMAGIMMFSSAGELALTVKASEANEPVIVEETVKPEETEAVEETAEEVSVITENMTTVVEEESVVTAAAAEETEIIEDELEVVTEGEIVEENYCGNAVTWALEDGVLTISGTGPMFSYTKVSATPWYANAAEITSVVVEDGVTTVAQYGFREFVSLESVVIGNDVTSIGAYAFYKCTALQAVVLGSSVTTIGNAAFGNDTGITELTVPNQECSIKYSQTFANVNPTKIKIRQDAESVSPQFLNFESITEIEIIEPAEEGTGSFFEVEDNVLFKTEETGKQIVRYLISKTDLTEYTIPDGVVSMADYAFAGTSLKKVNLPDGLKNISDYAFNECTALEEIVIPDSVLSVGNYAFNENTALLRAVIGNGVTTIGDYAFYKCTAMTVLSLGANVNQIGNDAFRGNSAIIELTVPNQKCSKMDSDAFTKVNPTKIKIRKDATEIDDEFLFYTNTTTFEAIDPLDSAADVNFISDKGVLYSEGGKVLLRFPQEKEDDLDYILMDNVTTVKEAAFSCTKIEKVELPESVIEIGEEAFYNCKALTEVRGGAGVTAIGNSAFYSCSLLREIVIADSVTAIGEKTFYLCTSLETVVLGSNITNVGKNAFYGDTSIRTLTVPNQEMTLSSGAFTSVAPTKIIFREDAQSISKNFLELASLEAFEMTDSVSDDTEGNFKAEDGVLYSSDGSRLIRYPAGKADLTEYAVLAGATGMSDYAFQGTKLEKVSLPEGLLSISAYAFYEGTSLKAVEIPNSVVEMGTHAFHGTQLEKISFPDSLLHIPAHAFYQCTNLKEIEIPDHIQTIGEYAFYGNAALVKVNIGAGVTVIENYTFANCSMLSELTIGESVTSIGYDAFSGNESLKKLVVPNSVTAIGNYAFENCSGLEDVVLGTNVTTMGDKTFSGTNVLRLTIPNHAYHTYTGGLTPSVIRVRGDADAEAVKRSFLLISTVTSFEIAEPAVEGAEIKYKAVDGVLYNADGSQLLGYPKGRSEETYEVLEGTKVIEESAFEASLIKHVYLPDTLEEIKYRAFLGCANLESLNMGSGLKNIGREAFRDCTLLTELVFSDSLRSLEMAAFYGCTALNKIAFTEGLNSIGEYTFQDCTSLTEIVIPDSVTELGGGCFTGCTGIHTLVIGNGVAVIPRSAFEGCINLVEIVMPDSVTVIEGEAFRSCQSLTEIVVPDSVTEIGKEAFASCSSLENAVLGLNLETAGSDMFFSCTSLRTLTLPNTGVKIVGLPRELKTIKLHADARGIGVIESAAEGLVQEYVVLEPAVENTAINYKSEDGVLYTADGKKLVLYPHGKEDTTYTVLDGTEIIGERAVAREGSAKISLTEMKFPDTLKTIEDLAFYDHDTLSVVSFPEGFTSIGRSAFSNCYKLDKMYLPKSLVNIGENGIFQKAPPTIYCEKQSYAEKYAIEHNIPCITSDYNIEYTLNMVYSVVDDVESRILKEDITDYQITLLNQTTGETLTGYRVYEKNIVLPLNQIAAGDVLIITLVSRNGETLDYQTEITLDENMSAVVEMNVQEKGYILTVPQSTANTTVLVFDEQGNRLEKMFYEDEPCVSGFYDDGTYELFYIQGENQYWDFETISEALERGLIEGEDYVTKKVTVKSGVITEVKDINVPEIELELSRYLNEDSNYMAETTAYVNGLLQLRIKYGFKEFQVDEIVPEYVHITIPENVVYVENSLTLDGKPVEAERLMVADTYLKVSVTDTEGIIRLMFRPINNKPIFSAAKIRFHVAGGSRNEVIGEIKLKVPAITLSCATQTSKQELLVYGTAIPGEKVGIYDGAVRVGTALTSKAGNWKTTIKLNRNQNDPIHKIQAKIYMGTSEELTSNITEVSYNADCFEITEFIMHYAYTIWGAPCYKTLDLLSSRVEKSSTFWLMGSNPKLTFTIKLSDNEVVDKMYVVSQKTGGIGKKKMEAFYDSETDTWIASGRFGLENERNYIPGDLSLEIVKSEKALLQEYNNIPEVDGNALVEAMKNPSFINTVNTYDEETDRGIYGGTLVFGENQVNSIDFSYSRQDVAPGTYTYEELLENGFIEIEDLDSTCRTLAKFEKTAEGGYEVRAIRVPAVSLLRSSGGDFDLGESIAKHATEEIVFNIIPGGSVLSFFYNYADFGTNNGGYEEKVRETEKELYREYRKGTITKEEYDKRQENIDALEDTGEAIRVMKAATTVISVVGPMIAFTGPAGLAATAILFATGVFASTCIDVLQYYYESLLEVQVKFAIDPSGYVYEGVPSNRVEGVTATVYYREIDADGSEKAVLWNAEEYDQQNPQITNEIGFYQWFVPEGYWQVKYEKEGYETAYSEWLPVPPPQTEVNIGLASTEPPKVELVELYDEYAMVTFSKYMKADTINSDTVKVLTMAGKEVPYEMEVLNGEAVDGINLATQFKLKFKDSLATGNYKVKVAKSVVNYADLTLESDYESVFAAKSAIRGLKAEVPKKVLINEKFTIPVTIDSDGDCSGYTLKAENTAFAEVLEISPIKNNVANITVKAKLPGTAVVQVTLDGTMIQENVEFNITMTPVEEEPTEPEKPVDPEEPTKVDKSALEAAIKAAEALNADDYKNFTAAEAALAQAKEVFANQEATQDTVDSVTKALNAAVAALEEKDEPVEPPVEPPVDPPSETMDEVVRLYGSGRYETGYKVADRLKEVLGAEKFEAVVVATGKNFADALAGSYLAVEKNAPILLTNGKADNVAELHAYIRANVKANGTIYILGGDGAVPETVDAIKGYTVKRLFGSSRYDTNIEILKEAGVNGDSIIVATGKTFADSLSASAAKLPILLVKPNGALNDVQKSFLKDRKHIYIVGGEGAVSKAYENELKEYGEVIRVFGSSRYDTSVEVAKTFCKDVKLAVVASGKNFPDGLCGGPLAAALNAPLVLTKDNGSDAAAAYVADNEIKAGYVLGGTGALSDETVVSVFALKNTGEILE